VKSAEQVVGQEVGQLDAACFIAKRRAVTHLLRSTGRAADVERYLAVAVEALERPADRDVVATHLRGDA